MNIGITTRAYPRVRVLRGWNPNEPQSLTQSLPVASGVTILSGQAISPKWNSSTSQNEWVLGLDSGATTLYVAVKDSTDLDVVSAGTLPALSCAGKFEIQTAFYKIGDTYNEGVFITADGVTGDFKAVAATTTTDNIYGVVTRIHGVSDLGPLGANEVSGVDVDGDGCIKVLTFSTLFVPNRKASSGS
jgi:hypothetical protein